MIIKVMERKANPWEGHPSFLGIHGELPGTRVLPLSFLYSLMFLVTRTGGERLDKSRFI